MSQSSFRQDTTLEDLGDGADFFLLAFRAFATGKPACSCLKNHFAKTFGQIGEHVLSDIWELTGMLGRTGRRKVRLGLPGCRHVTHDEISLLSSLNAAQNMNSSWADAHLQWLMGQAAPRTISKQIDIIANYFRDAGLSISTPEAQPVPLRDKKELASLVVLGSA